MINWKVGNKVLAIGNDETWKKGKIKDVLSTQYFIEFKDGCTAFIPKKNAKIMIKKRNKKRK